MAIRHYHKQRYKSSTELTSFPTYHENRKKKNHYQNTEKINKCNRRIA